MKMRIGLRRTVGSLLTATLVPWTTGCHHRVQFSPTSPPVTGKAAHVRSRAPATVNVILQDGTRAVIAQAIEADGVLARAGSDSVRLTNVVVKLTDKTQARYREAAFAVSSGVVIQAVRLDLVRTVLLLGGVVIIVGALISAGSFRTGSFNFQ